MKFIHKIALVCCFFIFIPGALIGAEPGDVNNDTQITIIDALLTAQYYVGLEPENFDPGVADINCDNVITIIDALLIAQYYVGLISEFPCSSPPDPTPLSQSNIYYIDSMTGNDQNDGLSQNTPWQHCPGMPEWDIGAYETE